MLIQIALSAVFDQNGRRSPWAGLESSIMLGILLKSGYCLKSGYWCHWEERHVEETEVVEVKSSKAESQSPILAKHHRFKLYTAPTLFPPPQSPLPWGLIKDEIEPLILAIACLR